MATYSYSHFIEIGRVEVECEITYRVEPGFAGDRVDPPYDASVEVLEVHVVLPNGVREIAPKWLSDIIENDDGICSDMLADAEGWGGPDPDRARDARIDDELMARAR